MYHICKASVPPCIRNEENCWVSHLPAQYDEDFTEQLNECKSEYDLDRLLSRYTMYAEIDSSNNRTKNRLCVNQHTNDFSNRLVGQTLLHSRFGQTRFWNNYGLN